MCLLPAASGLTGVIRSSWPSSVLSKAASVPSTVTFETFSRKSREKLLRSLVALSAIVVRPLNRLVAST